MTKRCRQPLGMKSIQRYSHCFVCGDKNEVGLKVDFFEEDEKAKAEYVCTSDYEGYKGILHGGIISALLDEVMIKAIFARGSMTVTSHLEVQFRKPARIGEKLLLEGHISQDKGRLILAFGKAFRQDGTVIALAQGRYFKAKKKLKKVLKRSLE